MTVADTETALRNVQFAVQRRLQTEPPPRTASAETAAPGSELERVTRVSQRVIGFLRTCLLSPEPAALVTGQTQPPRTAEALTAQHPAILVARKGDHDCRPDPSYPWSDERRVPQSLALGSFTHVLVPERHIADLKRRGPPAGLRAEIVPLEYFEALRLVAEGLACASRAQPGSG
jgi:hypothetical protein